MEVQLFDRTFQLSSDAKLANYDLKKLRETMQALQSEIKRPQILSYIGMECITFYDAERKMDNFHSFSVVEWLYNHCPEQRIEGDIRGTMLALSTEDTAWTDWRNAKESGIFHRKITFNPGTVQLLTDEIQEALFGIEALISLTEKQLEEECRAKELAAIEKERLLNGVQWDVAARPVKDEGGITNVFKHTLQLNGEQFTFFERNVFDVGRVINPQGGGLVRNGGDSFFVETFQEGEGWVPFRKLSDNEARAFQIVHRYGMLADAPVRMTARTAHEDFER